MSKVVLLDNIKKALKSGLPDPNIENASLDKIATDISDAISFYVSEELVKLKTALINSGAFTVDNVPTTAGTINNYNPGTE